MTHDHHDAASTRLDAAGLACPTDTAGLKLCPVSEVGRWPQRLPPLVASRQLLVRSAGVHAAQVRAAAGREPGSARRRRPAGRLLCPDQAGAAAANLRLSASAPAVLSRGLSGLQAAVPSLRASMEGGSGLSCRGGHYHPIKSPIEAETAYQGQQQQGAQIPRCSGCVPGGGSRSAVVI